MIWVKKSFNSLKFQKFQKHNGRHKGSIVLKESCGKSQVSIKSLAKFVVNNFTKKHFS